MKKLIRRIFNQFGYDIIKTNVPYFQKSKNDKTVMVRKYPIIMPGNNVQSINYRLYPDLNAQFGRLAKVIHEKYPGMSVIDVGANVGDTIAVIKSFVDCPVIGVEGDDVSYSYLERNIVQFKNVSIVKTFLGEKNERVNVQLDKAGWNTTIIPGKAADKTISLRTLDEVISESSNNEKNIKLLKVDVEGFDTIVLRGAYSIIEHHRPVLFFEYNRDNMQLIGEDGLSTILSFRTYGFNKIIFFDHKGRMLVSTSLENEEVISRLHHYALGKDNLLGYYDICVFHENDNDIANKFLEEESGYVKD